jgi:pSer/pThr/pTyr-binding forkhead associated (FHA) protein
LIVRLELPNKPPREFSYDFRQDVISIGRDPKNDIQIPLTTVSRNHARIFYELGDFFLEDLGSTHGTLLNEKKMSHKEKKLLRDGDVMRVMSFSLTFKTAMGTMLDRQPGEKTEHLARRMVQEVLSSLAGRNVEPTTIRAMNGPDEGRRFEVSDDQAEVTIGRSPDCDFPVDDQNTSRRHCLIKRTWNGFTVQDLGSKNGVLLNGRKIEQSENLQDGDEIQIGGLKLLFIDPASRILEQFGGADKTVGPSAAVDTQAEDADSPGGEDGEGDGDSSYEEQEAPEEEPEPVAENEPEEPDPSQEKIELPDPSQIKIPKTGSGTEVLILLVAVVILLGAVGVAVFLYL